MRIKWAERMNPKPSPTQSRIRDFSRPVNEDKWPCLHRMLCVGKDHCKSFPGKNSPRR